MPVIKLRGLPWSCTNDDILKFLKDIKIREKRDDLIDLRFTQVSNSHAEKSEVAIYMLTNSEGRPSGEAFIDLVDDDDLEMALKRHNALMGQRYIEVFRSNYDQMNKQIEESINRSSNWTDPVVRLRGLPYGCSKQDISTFFDGLNISYEGIMMVIDFSGRFNGEAFVQFDDILNAYRALDRHKQKISNRYIEVFRSTFDEMTYYSNNSQRASSTSNATASYRTTKTGEFSNRRGNYDDTYQARKRKSSRSPAQSYDKGSNNGDNYFQQDDGLGHNEDESDNYNIFHKNDDDQDNADFNDNSTRTTYNNFQSNRFKSNQPHKNNYNNLNNDAIKQRSFNGIKLRGLPYNCTEKDIINFFAPLKPTDIIFPNQSKRNTECECHFETNEEANEAMKYDKKYIGKRYIELFPLTGGNSTFNSNRSEFNLNSNKRLKNYNNDEKNAYSSSGPSLSLSSSYYNTYNNISNFFNTKNVQNYGNSLNKIEKNHHQVYEKAVEPIAESAFSTVINELISSNALSKFASTVNQQQQQQQQQRSLANAPTLNDFHDNKNSNSEFDDAGVSSSK